jgi:hypothetical protein
VPVGDADDGVDMVTFMKKWELRIDAGNDRFIYTCRSPRLILCRTVVAYAQLPESEVGLGIRL